MKSAMLLSRLMLILLIINSTFFLLSCKRAPSRNKRDKTYQDSRKHDREASDVSAKTDTDITREPASYNFRWLDSTDIPPVAIVIDDFGQIGNPLLQGFAELDEEVTFAVLPDLPYTQKSAQLANIYRHEVILHIPMQAAGTSLSPGERYIKAGMDKKEIEEILLDFLKQVPQAVGANNHMGSGATADYQTMVTVMEILKSRGLFFLDSKTTPHTKALEAAMASNADYAARDMFLDVPDVSNETLNAKLKELEKYRGRKEPIIIISHCHNQAKLDAMRTFIGHLKGLGIRLIPLSEAIREFDIPS